MKVTINFQQQNQTFIDWVAHDYIARDDRWRIGMPAVFPLYYSQYCRLDEEWQWFWFRQMVHAYTNYSHWDEKRLSRAELEMLKAKWRSLTKSSEAFTNFKGTNENKDYVSPNNLSGQAGQEPLICTGATVKILAEPRWISGENKTPIETLNGNAPPPDIAKVNRVTTPHLIFAATNNPADKTDPRNWKPIQLPDGRYKVDPFPHFQDSIFPVKDVPVPLRSNGKEAPTYYRNGISLCLNYIRSSRLIQTTKSQYQLYVR